MAWKGISASSAAKPAGLSGTCSSICQRAAPLSSVTSIQALHARRNSASRKVAHKTGSPSRNRRSDGTVKAVNVAVPLASMPMLMAEPESLGKRSAGGAANVG